MVQGASRGGCGGGTKTLEFLVLSEQCRWVRGSTLQIECSGREYSGPEFVRSQLVPFLSERIEQGADLLSIGADLPLNSHPAGPRVCCVDTVPSVMTAIGRLLEPWKGAERRSVADARPAANAAGVV